MPSSTVGTVEELRVESCEVVLAEEDYIPPHQHHEFLGAHGLFRQQIEATRHTVKCVEEAGLGEPICSLNALPLLSTPIS